MIWRSLMSLREAAGGGWPDTMNGAGKATLRLRMRAAKAISTLRKQHTAEFRWTFQGVLATSLSTSDEAKMFTKLSLFCHPLVSYKPSHIIKGPLCLFTWTRTKPNQTSNIQSFSAIYAMQATFLSSMFSYLDSVFSFCFPYHCYPIEAPLHGEILSSIGLK